MCDGIKHFLLMFDKQSDVALVLVTENGKMFAMKNGKLAINTLWI